MTDFKVSQLPVASDGAEGDFVIINKGNTTTNRIDVKKLVEGFGDVKYLRTDVAAGDQTVLSTGTTTFNSLVEAGGGVEVTGGSLSSIDNGLFSDGVSVGIVSGGGFATIAPTTFNFVSEENPLAAFTANAQFAQIRVKNTTLNNPTLRLITEVDKADLTSHNVVTTSPVYTNVADNAYLSGFVSNTPANNTSATGVTYAGFQALNMADKFDINLGFNSQLNIGSTKSNFNFYSQGTAPNYFRGETFVGGNEFANANFKIAITGKVRTTNGYVTCADGLTDDDTPQFDNSGKAGVSLGGAGTVVSQYFSSAPAQAVWYLNRSGSDTGQLMQFGYADTVSGARTTAGIIRLASPNSISIVETSDYRLKENISDIENASDRVKSIKPCKYNFINDPGRTHEGFIAHELQDIASQCVTGEKDEVEPIGNLIDYDGTVLKTEVIEPDASELEYTEESTDEEGVATQITRTRTWTPTGTRPVYQGVDQTKLIPLLTKALQEALTEIDNLKARLDVLEGN